MCGGCAGGLSGPSDKGQVLNLFLRGVDSRTYNEQMVNRYRVDIAAASARVTDSVQGTMVPPMAAARERK